MTGSVYSELDDVLVTAYSRGHKIYFSLTRDEWLYHDNNKPIDEMRPCAKCGEKPTPEGYDACLGYLDGISSACCGHGKSNPILTKKDIEG